MRRITVSAALVSVLVLYAMVFGLNVVTSVGIWPLGVFELNTGGEDSSARELIGGHILVTVISVGGFCLAVCAVGASRLWSPWDTIKTVLLRRPPASVWLGAFGLFLLAGLVSGSAANSLGELTGNVPQREELSGDGAGEIAEMWVSLITAGFKEEPVIVAVSVLLLVVAGRGSICLAIAVSMLMRWMIHLYYGPGSDAYLFWACVAVVLYLYGRTLMPLIAAHLWWNVGVGLEMFGFVTSAQLNIATLVVGFGGFAFACLHLESVSAWVNGNPWNPRLVETHRKSVRPEQRVRRRKAWRAVGWAAVDTGVAVLSIGLGVITSVKSLSTIHAVVFAMVGVVSLLGLWTAGKTSMDWLMRAVLVLNSTYYGAVGCTLATELIGGGPAETGEVWWMRLYLVGCGGLILGLAAVKHGMAILPDGPKNVDR